MLSFEIPFDTLFIWEEFNANEFGPDMFKLKDPVLTEIHLNLQSMIRNFVMVIFMMHETLIRLQENRQGFMGICRY